MAKIQNFLIPYQKYYIDSGKFFIDSDKFLSVKIPQNFTLIDSDTGEALNDFKRSSLELKYNNTKVYIATVKKQLKQCSIDKVLIYFSSKVAGENYFYGIQKNHVIEILEYIKKIGYLDFKNVNDIYKEIYVKDLDIKYDINLTSDEYLKLSEYNKILSERFNGIADQCKYYDNQKQGKGIQCYHRDRSVIAKPFCKFYSKSKELLITKQRDFFDMLSQKLQNEVLSNFIYRYEFTLKDRTFFNKFNISNRLQEIHEITQQKWHEIGKYFLNTNFQVKIRKPKDTSKLRPVEAVLCLHFLALKECGYSITKIKNMYISPQKSRKQKHRMSLMFDRIYYNTGIEHSREIQVNYEWVNKLDKVFGFI